MSKQELSARLDRLKDFLKGFEVNVGWMCDTAQENFKKDFMHKEKRRFY
jgi:hypothetical protein